MKNNKALFVSPPEYSTIEDLKNQHPGTGAIYNNLNISDILRWHTDNGYRLVHSFQCRKKKSL